MGWSYKTDTSFFGGVLYQSKIFGNPAPVVIDADGLIDCEIVLIVKKLNASETMFVSIRFQISKFSFLNQKTR